MSLDRNKLENVVQIDGKITARCPACQEDGGDNTGNHLVVYPYGRFGCVVNPGSSEHRRRIFRLVGKRNGSSSRKKSKKKTRLAEKRGEGTRSMGT